MIIKKLIKPIFYIILIITTINLYSCNKNNKITFSTDINAAMAKISQNTNYNKYIDIIMKQPVTSPAPVKDEQGKTNSDNNYVSENLIFKNVTDKKIKFNVKIFLAKELITSIAYAPASFGLNKEITLAPGQSADIAAAIIMKKMELLTDEEKNIYDNYSEMVYVELKINNNFYSFIQKTDSN